MERSTILDGRAALLSNLFSSLHLNARTAANPCDDSVTQHAETQLLSRCLLALNSLYDFRPPPETTLETAWPQVASCIRRLRDDLDLLSTWMALNLQKGRSLHPARRNGGGARVNEATDEHEADADEGHEHIGADLDSLSFAQRIALAQPSLSCSLSAMLHSTPSQQQAVLQVFGAMYMRLTLEYSEVDDTINTPEAPSNGIKMSHSVYDIGEARRMWQERERQQGAMSVRQAFVVDLYESLAETAETAVDGSSLLGECSDDCNDSESHHSWVKDDESSSEK